MKRFLFGFCVAASAAAGLWFFRTPTAEERMAAYEKAAATRGSVIYHTTLLDKHMIFEADNCRVYLLDNTGLDVQRTKVVRSGFYFFLDGCMEQNFSRDADYLYVYLSNRAIGAGGGNTSGGNYRTNDGLTWEKRMDRGWEAVETAQL
ncbi:MAG: hypothetical protein FJW32_00710 [Acidobacteria bacterium]|nr:hypothetical protein [Acidobacteriota bacterium]